MTAPQTSAHRHAVLHPVPGDQATAWHLLLVLLDLAVVSGTFVLALSWNVGRHPIPAPLWLLYLAAPIQVVSFALAGAYDVTVPGRSAQWAGRAVRGHALFLVVLMVTLYVTATAANVPRLAFALWAGGAGVMLLGLRALLAWLVRRTHHAGLGTRAVLVGDWASCSALRGHLAAHPELGIRPVAIASNDHPEVTDIPASPIAETASLALGRSATTVLICTSFNDAEALGQVVDELMPFPIEVRLVPDLEDFPLFCMTVSDLAGRPCIALAANPLSPRDLLIKRLEDVVLSAVILMCITPIMAAVAVGVRLFNGPGPILFAQRRHGLMGRTITVYKFRTMTWSPDYVPGPDEADGQSGMNPAVNLLDPAHAFLNPTTGVFRQVQHQDIRVTRFGKFLRSSSLDELPQFWNVLKGDLSIVGPRPHARKHNLQFLTALPHLMRRHYVKPGITGLAQVNGARGRADDVASMERRLTYDLAYIRSWSLWLDLKIIAKTVVVGFFNREP